ncbi:hypothetical protein OIO90_005433 [Microbotryomycetes sp. JL221]|nr:hypothetical protein OIO90_005433 [Microbotryomycetes sp. JL221]
MALRGTKGVAELVQHHEQEIKRRSPASSPTFTRTARLAPAPDDVTLAKTTTLTATSSNMSQQETTAKAASVTDSTNSNSAETTTPKAAATQDSRDSKESATESVEAKNGQNESRDKQDDGRIGDKVKQSNEVSAEAAAAKGSSDKAHASTSETNSHDDSSNKADVSAEDASKQQQQTNGETASAAASAKSDNNDGDSEETPLAKIANNLESLPVTEQDVIRRNIEAVNSYPPELPLTTSWTLHFSDTSSASKSNHGTTADQYDDAVKKVFEADTVPLLCGNLKAFKRLAKPKKARDDSLGLTRAGQNLHFFRTGVSPTWEDPWNAKGGRLTISPPAAVFESVYERLLLLVAGSVLEMQATAAHEDNKSKKSEETGQIIGVVASRRARGDRIEVWLGGTDQLQPPNSEWIDKLKESLSEQLGMPELRGGKYKRHFS